jgi:hypothetical protein
MAHYMFFLWSIAIDAHMYADTGFVQLMCTGFTLLAQLSTIKSILHLEIGV